MSGQVRLERALSGCVDPDSVDRIQDLLSQTWADTADVDEIDRVRFETAVIEVAGNIIAHSDRSGPFDCRLVVRVCADELRAEFTDTAAAVDIDIDAVRMPDELAESGRGLAIARAAVDELSYRRVDGRNHWLIARRRTPVAAPDPARSAP